MLKSLSFVTPTYPPSFTASHIHEHYKKNHN
jgi:hypothetical protein